MTKVSFTFFPHKGKKSAKTGQTPIYMRIVFNKAKAEQRLNLEIDDLQLRLWNPVLMRIELQNCLTNDHLDNISNAFRQFLSLNDHNLAKFTATQIRDQVLQRDCPKQITVIDYIDSYYKQSIMNKSELTAGTKKNYRKANNHMITFLNYSKKANLKINEMDNAFSVEFKNYLLNDISKLNKKGMLQPSALGIIKKFRTIFNQAVNQDLISKNPYLFIKLSTKSPKKPRLNSHQIRELINSENKLTPTEIIYKDIFLFSVFTGLAYVDAANVKKDCIEVRENGDVKFSMQRQKTGEYAEQFLNQFAVDIIEKYKNNPYVSVSNGLIPKKSNKELNRHIKIIAVKIGIPFVVSSHTARHSFRQMLSESGIEDDGVIKRMMGQSRKDEVDNVYYEITETRLMEAKIKLNNFLKTNLS